MEGLQSYLPQVVQALQLRRDEGHRLVMLQHLFDDTFRMIKALKPYIEIDVIIGIPYSSSRPGLAQRWQEELGISVVVPDSLDALEPALVAEFERVKKLCQADGKKMILQEVGGFGVPILHRYFEDDLSWVRGAVEITKQGVWRAQRVANLSIPVLHCAESELKRLEASLCGDSIVLSIDQLLRGHGMCLAGQRALVLGHGWIGRGVANALRAKGAMVAVSDPDPLKQVEARLNGFFTPELTQWAPQATLVVGASGACSITAELIDQLADGCLIASGSSRDLEIDIQYLNRFPSRTLGPHIRAFHVGSRTLYLVNNGYPANFVGSSVPDEIVEMILAELIVLIGQLNTRSFAPGIYPIAQEWEQIPAQIWLQMRDGWKQPSLPPIPQEASVYVVHPEHN